MPNMTLGQNYTKLTQAYYMRSYKREHVWLYVNSDRTWLIHNVAQNNQSERHKKQLCLDWSTEQKQNWFFLLEMSTEQLLLVHYISYIQKKRAFENSF